MKKIALLLSLVMLLCCGFVFVSCGESVGTQEQAEASLENAIKDAVDEKGYLTYNRYRITSVVKVGECDYKFEGYVDAENLGGDYKFAEFSAYAKYSKDAEAYTIELEDLYFVGLPGSY